MYMYKFKKKLNAERPPVGCAHFAIPIYIYIYMYIYI